MRGAQQAVEYGSSSSGISYTTKDDTGVQRKPDDLPAITIYNPSDSELVAPATVKAELDFGAAGLTNFDTVIEMQSNGSWGNDWTVQVAAAVAAAITVDWSDNTILIEYIDGVSTVTAIETLITALTGDYDVIEIKTAGTGANVLSSPGDDLAATSMASGVGASMFVQHDTNEKLTEGFLAYNTQTAEFKIGKTLTGGTSAATGIIRGQRRTGATGILYLSNVDGIFANAETITDSGSGSAKASGNLYTCEHFYSVDASDTTDYEIDVNYKAKIEYYIDESLYTHWLYFDVGFYPMTAPVVTSEDIDEMHANWLPKRDKRWTDWGPAVRAGHADLVRRIHAHGEQAAFYVKREQEFWRVEMAFIEYQIAKTCGFEDVDRDFWRDNKESAWRSRGLLTKQEDADAEIEEEQNVIQAQLLK
jgi:hypothetical protein